MRYNGTGDGLIYVVSSVNMYHGELLVLLCFVLFWFSVYQSASDSQCLSAD